jgi:hypothetical protein
MVAFGALTVVLGPWLAVRLAVSVRCTYELSNLGIDTGIGTAFVRRK